MIGLKLLSKLKKIAVIENRSQTFSAFKEKINFQYFHFIYEASLRRDDLLIRNL